MPARLQFEALLQRLLQLQLSEDLTWAASLEVTDIFDVIG